MAEPKIGTNRGNAGKGRPKGALNKATDGAIPSEVKRDEAGKFIVPPKSPGRPKGSRNKLTEQFLADVYAAWQKSGETCIAEMIADKPGDFVKLVAMIIPKEATLNINDHSEMTDDELAERVRNLAAQLAPFLVNGIGDAEAGIGIEKRAEEPPRVH